MTSAPRLQSARPADWPVAPDWQPLLDRFWTGAGAPLIERLQQRLDAGALIYPPQPLRALALTPRAEVRVVILGQDPYHGPAQAEGLAFSVAPGVPIPPSLRNIRLELAQDPALAPWTPPPHGSLQAWARQGVLLLNTCLTVEDGSPASHSGWGWEALTDLILSDLIGGGLPRVFMLWGAHAQKAAARAGLPVPGAAPASASARRAKSAALAPDVSYSDGEALAPSRHCVLAANHPSPLSARRGPLPFLGCAHFSQARDFLQARGLGAIYW